MPAGDPGLRVGDQQHPYVGVGRDHRGDVAALGDDPAGRRRRSGRFCRATRSARTSRLVATALTTADTSGARIAVVTSVPLIAMVNASGSSTRSISRVPDQVGHRGGRRSGRPPAARASQVAARYIAPVSRNARPRRRATPAGGAGLPRTAGAVDGHDQRPSPGHGRRRASGITSHLRVRPRTPSQHGSDDRPAVGDHPRHQVVAGLRRAPTGPGSRPRGPGRARSRCPRR